jgi:hypothetical protein
MLVLELVQMEHIQLVVAVQYGWKLQELHL